MPLCSTAQARAALAYEMARIIEYSLLYCLVFKSGSPFIRFTACTTSIDHERLPSRGENSAIWWTLAVWR